MRSVFMLSGHPGPATESKCVRNDDPSWDSAATSFLSSHDDSIGARAPHSKGTPAVGSSDFRSSIVTGPSSRMVRT
jgi:hypothetical protein